MLLGHYSARKHLNLLDRLDRAEQRAHALAKQAGSFMAKARAAEGFQARRESVSTTQNRIKALEKEIRDYTKRLDGWEAEWKIADPADDRSLDERAAERGATVIQRISGTNYAIVKVPPTLKDAAEYEAQIVLLSGAVGYWQAHLAAKEAAGVKIWRRGDFVKGDFVSYDGDRWYEVCAVNARSVSVPKPIGSNGSKIGVRAVIDHLHRTRATTQTLPYRDVRAKMSAKEARARFPDAFTDPPDGAPTRPAAKDGKIKVEHHSGAKRENWYFQVNGDRYRICWNQPDGWHTSNAVDHPLTVLEPAKVYLTLPGALREEPTDLQITIEGPVHYFEDVHNQIRAWIEDHAEQQAPSGARQPRTGSPSAQNVSITFECGNAQDAALILHAVHGYAKVLHERGEDLRNYAPYLPDVGAGFGWNTVEDAARAMHAGSRTHMSERIAGALIAALTHHSSQHSDDHSAAALAQHLDALIRTAITGN